MFNATDIKEQAEVIGSDGKHVGTVDHLDGGRIKLTRTDSQDGKHHFLSLDTVDTVDGDRVKLSLSASEAWQQSTLQ